MGTIVPLCLGTPLDHISSEVQIEMRRGPCRWSSKRAEKATQRGGCRMSIVIRITITTVAGVGHTEKGEREKKWGGKHFALLNFIVWLLVVRNVSWTCLKITSPCMDHNTNKNKRNLDFFRKSLWKLSLSSFHDLWFKSEEWQRI